MHVPEHWAKREEEFQTRDNRTLRAAVWGWGDDPAAAETAAERRLSRLLERVSRGEPFPDAYAYGDRPLREEILETIPTSGTEALAAIVTRNRYGALVLNTADMLFLDIDLPPAGVGSLFRRLFSRGPDPREAALEQLQQTLNEHGRGSFRIYRTAAGFRAMAVDRPFDPAGTEAQGLMAATGTDPAFMRLCRVQKSFRARLTPKPWRCGMKQPPGQYPWLDDGARRRFDRWLDDYQRKSTRYATCALAATTGDGAPSGVNEQIVNLHDAMTRCGEQLPLA